MLIFDALIVSVDYIVWPIVAFIADAVQFSYAASAYRKISSSNFPFAYKHSEQKMPYYLLFF